MTTKNPSPGNNTGLPTLPLHHGRLSAFPVDTMQGRVEQWCAMFDLPPFKVGRGNVDRIVDWCTVSGASIDWIVSGDVKGMASRYRNNVLQEQEAVHLFRNVEDPVEKEMLFLAMVALADPVTSPADVQEAFKASIAKHRAGKAKAVLA